MDYKSQSPILGLDQKLNTEMLLGYIEDLKSETEARITLIENIIEQLKSNENT